MKRRSPVRYLAPVVSAFAGVCCAAALVSSCSDEPTGCCPEPRPIVTGDYRNVTARIPEGAPASLQDLDVKRLVIGDATVVVEYTRGDEAGTATFTFGSMY
jgi:hypothetical protein